MLRRHAPWGDPYDRGYLGGGWPPPSLMEVRARWLAWLWRLALAGGSLALVAYVVGHDDPREPGLSDRSWLTLGLAAALVALLSVHRAAGVVPLLRALAEYGVVALLVVLLATGPGAFAPATTHHAHPAGRAGAAATARPGQRAASTPGKAAHGCPPVRQLPAWVACLWRQANPTPTKPGALSPAIPSTRRTP
ncbi:MAG TPA: hypothetical protein VGM21_11205 [Actinomycetota bacterium]|jgi:hypothetical protein